MIIEGFLEGRIEEFSTDGRMAGWLAVDGWMDGWMYGWMGERIYGWTDGAEMRRADGWMRASLQ